MATLKVKIERLLRKGKKNCEIWIGSSEEIYFSESSNSQFNEFASYCGSLEDLERMFPKISESEVIRQTTHFDIPVFVVDYSTQKFNEYKWKAIFTEKLLDIQECIDNPKRWMSRETWVFRRKLYMLGLEIINCCNLSDKQIAESVQALMECYDEYDYKALQTMMYMLTHPEVQKAKITFCYNASQFWVALGHKKHLLKANDYCIEL